MAVVIYVKKYRKKRNLTIAQLSEITGISVGHISNIENNLCSPTLDTICRISKGLQVNVHELFECKSYKTDSDKKKKE